MSTVETLREVNASLQLAMTRLRSENQHCSAITPDDFAGLLSEILRGAECLRFHSSQSEASEAMREAALAYRTNLEKLRDFLPELQGNLLAEKARLETARAHVQAVGAWARSSTRTL